MLSVCTLVPEGRCCVLYATRHQVYWSLTHNLLCYFANTWISYHTHKHTHTHTHTQQTQGPIDWHTHINIYWHHMLCPLSIYLYYIQWIICWHQTFTLQSFKMPLLFKNWSFIEVRGHSHIKSSYSLHQNDVKFQAHPLTTLYVKMPNVPKSDVYTSDIKSV